MVRSSRRDAELRACDASAQPDAHCRSIQHWATKLDTHTAFWLGTARPTSSRHYNSTRLREVHGSPLASLDGLCAPRGAGRAEMQGMPPRAHDPAAEGWARARLIQLVHPWLAAFPSAAMAEGRLNGCHRPISRLRNRALARMLGDAPIDPGQVARGAAVLAPRDYRRAPRQRRKCSLIAHPRTSASAARTLSLCTNRSACAEVL